MWKWTNFFATLDLSIRPKGEYKKCVKLGNLISVKLYDDVTFFSGQCLFFKDRLPLKTCRFYLVEIYYSFFRNGSCTGCDVLCCISIPFKITTLFKIHRRWVKCWGPKDRSKKVKALITYATVELRTNPFMRYCTTPFRKYVLKYREGTQRNITYNRFYTVTLNLHPPSEHSNVLKVYFFKSSKKSLMRFITAWLNNNFYFTKSNFELFIVDITIRL